MCDLMLSLDSDGPYQSHYHSRLSCSVDHDDHDDFVDDGGDDEIQMIYDERYDI